MKTLLELSSVLISNYTTENNKKQSRLTQNSMMVSRIEAPNIGPQTYSYRNFDRGQKYLLGKRASPANGPTKMGCILAEELNLILTSHSAQKAILTRSKTSALYLKLQRKE